MRPLNVLMIGNAHFARHLCLALAPQVESRFFDTSGSKRELLSYLWHLPRADVVFSECASLRGGGALKAACLFNKPIVQEFMGSDVTTAIADVRHGRVNAKLRRLSTFICNAPWLQDELSNHGIVSTVIPDYVGGVGESALPLPAVFSVLSYVPDNKEDHYGMDMIVEAARALPQIPFRVVGLKQSRWSIPNNMICLGMVDERALEREMQSATVYLRLTRHDGLSQTVVQALGMGRWVIRSQPMEGTFFSCSSAVTIEHLTRLFAQFQAQTLSENSAGHAFVKRMYDRETVVGSLVAVMRAAAAAKSP